MSFKKMSLKIKIKTTCHMLQGMAGNIIHAIATTNAIIAGFIVVEAIKLLTGAQQACKVTLQWSCLWSLALTLLL